MVGVAVVAQQIVKQEIKDVKGICDVYRTPVFTSTKSESVGGLCACTV